MMRSDEPGRHLYRVVEHLNNMDWFVYLNREFDPSIEAVVTEKVKMKSLKTVQSNVPSFVPQDCQLENG